MQRILLVLAAALIMAAIMAAMAMVSFADPKVATNGGGNQPPGQATFPCNSGDGHQPTGGGITCQKP